MTRTKHLFILRSIGQKSRSVTFIITLGSTVLKLDVEVGSDSNKTPVDFEVSRSKVKVTVAFIIKSLSDQ